MGKDIIKWLFFVVLMFVSWVLFYAPWLTVILLGYAILGIVQGADVALGILIILAILIAPIVGVILPSLFINYDIKKGRNKQQALLFNKIWFFLSIWLILSFMNELLICAIMSITLHDLEFTLIVLFISAVYFLIFSIIVYKMIYKKGIFCTNCKITESDSENKQN